MIGMIDYGLGNIRSVVGALSKIEFVQERSCVPHARVANPFHVAGSDSRVISVPRTLRGVEDCMMCGERRAVPIDLALVRTYGVARWQEEFFWQVSDATYLGMRRKIEHAIEPVSRTDVVTEDFHTSHRFADAFFFGPMRTTAFPIALCTQKPIVALLVDSEPATPFPDALALLARRVAIIRAALDDHARVMFDPAALVAAFVHPVDPTDTAFLDTYLATPGVT